MQPSVVHCVPDLQVAMVIHSSFMQPCRFVPTQRRAPDEQLGCMFWHPSSVQRVPEGQVAIAIHSPFMQPKRLFPEHFRSPVEHSRRGVGGNTGLNGFGFRYSGVGTP